MTALVAVAVLLAAGYALGRIQPGRRASNWARWVMAGDLGLALPRSDWRWWAAQPVFAVEIAWLLITHPRRTVHNWRHHNDPPPPRSAPIRFRSLTDQETDRA